MPDQLDTWTFTTVADIVHHHEFEPGAFDYKEALNATGSGREEALASLRRTVCSMANTDGGYVLFGVRDRRHAAASPMDRIVGIPISDHRKEFGDKIQGLQPEVFFEAIPRPLLLPCDETKAVFVVHIPISPRRPHMIRSTGVFYRRGEGGSADPMDYYQVREQMLFTEERLRRLALFRLQLAMFREVVDLIEAEGRHAGTLHALDRFDTAVYGVLLADVATLLPDNEALLQDLIRVPILARRINVGLDRFQSGAAGQAFTSERVQRALTDLVNLINGCQIALAERFGAA